MYSERSIINALRKSVSPEGVEALKGAYMDDADVVHKKTGKTIASAKLNGIFKELVNDVNSWAKKNSTLFMPKPKSKGGDIDISSDVRAIVTTDEETANKIKKMFITPEIKLKCVS